MYLLVKRMLEIKKIYPYTPMIIIVFLGNFKIKLNFTVLFLSLYQGSGYINFIQAFATHLTKKYLVHMPIFSCTL